MSAVQPTVSLDPHELYATANFVRTSEDDDPKAVIILLKIFHFIDPDIPEELITPKTVAMIARLCEKWKCEKALGPYPKMWLSILEKNYLGKREPWQLWLRIGKAFGRRDIVESITAETARSVWKTNGFEELEALKSSGMDAQVIDQLQENRVETITYIARVVAEALELMLKKDRMCCNTPFSRECDALIFGSRMRIIVHSVLNVIPKRPYGSLSVMSLIGTLGLKQPDAIFGLDEPAHNHCLLKAKEDHGKLCDELESYVEDCDEDVDQILFSYRIRSPQKTRSKPSAAAIKQEDTTSPSEASNTKTSFSTQEADNYAMGLTSKTADSNKLTKGVERISIPEKCKFNEGVNLSDEEVRQVSNVQTDNATKIVGGAEITPANEKVVSKNDSSITELMRTSPSKEKANKTPDMESFGSAVGSQKPMIELTDTYAENIEANHRNVEETENTSDLLSFDETRSEGKVEQVEGVQKEKLVDSNKLRPMQEVIPSSADFKSGSDHGDIIHKDTDMVRKVSFQTEGKNNQGLIDATKNVNMAADKITNSEATSKEDVKAISMDMEGTVLEIAQDSGRTECNIDSMKVETTQEEVEQATTRLQSFNLDNKALPKGETQSSTPNALLKKAPPHTRASAPSSPINSPVVSLMSFENPMDDRATLEHSYSNEISDKIALESIVSAHTAIEDATPHIRSSIRASEQMSLMDAPTETSILQEATIRYPLGCDVFIEPEDVAKQISFQIPSRSSSRGCFNPLAKPFEIMTPDAENNKENQRLGERGSPHPITPTPANRSVNIGMTKRPNTPVQAKQPASIASHVSDTASQGSVATLRSSAGGVGTVGSGTWTPLQRQDLMVALMDNKRKGELRNAYRSIDSGTILDIVYRTGWDYHAADKLIQAIAFEHQD